MDLRTENFCRISLPNWYTKYSCRMRKVTIFFLVSSSKKSRNLFLSLISRNFWNLSFQDIYFMIYCILLLNTKLFWERRTRHAKPTSLIEWDSCGLKQYKFINYLKILIWRNIMVKWWLCPSYSSSRWQIRLLYKNSTTKKRIILHYLF